MVASVRKQLVMPAAKQYVSKEKKHCLKLAAQEMTTASMIIAGGFRSLMHTVNSD